MEAFDIDYNVNKYLDEISNSQFNEINDDTYVLHDANMNPQSTVSSISKVTIVLLLLNTMLGSGILNQPYVISQSGIVGSAVLFIFSGFFTWIGMQTLIICGSSHGKLDYADIAEYAFGPYGKQAVNFIVVLNTFGGLMSYITIMGGTLSELFQSWGCGSEKVICDVYSVTIIVTIFLIFPLCLLRYFGEIVQKLSLISILGLFGVVALVLIASPIEATDNRNKVLAFNAVGSVSSCGSIIFSISCLAAAFHTYKSIDKSVRNTEVWTNISGWGVSSGMILCFFTGLVGYLSFQSSTHGDILDNFNKHYADPFKLCFIIHMILFIPLDFIVMRNSVAILLKLSNTTVVTMQSHVLLTVVLLGGNTLLCLALRGAGYSKSDAFGIILALTGGVATSCTSFIFPSLLYLKLMPKSAPLFYHSIATLVFGILIFTTVPIVSILHINGVLD